MSAVTFDPSRQIDFYFRVSRAGSKTLTFVDTLGADYSLAAIDFQFLIKDYFGNTLLTLTEGNGLTVQNTNELVIAITVAQSTLTPAEYYYQLNLTSSNKTWLNGKAFFHTGIFDGVTETTTITITESGDDITVTISESGASPATQAQVNAGTATGVYVDPKTLEEKVEVKTASGTDTYTATIPGTLTTGRKFFVLFTNANTGPATLNGTAIKKSVSSSLASGDISAGEIKLLAYDGTNFQIVGGSGSGGGTWGSIAGTLSDQTDLQAALNAKIETVSVDGVTITGDGTPGNPLVSSSAGLQPSNNLSDVSNAATSLANLGGMPLGYTVNSQTVNYELVVGDFTVPTSLEMNDGSGLTLTVPTNATAAIPLSRSILIRQMGAGVVTITPAGGVTINTQSSSYVTNGQYTYVLLTKVGTNSWILDNPIATNVANSQLATMAAATIKGQPMTIDGGSTTTPVDLTPAQVRNIIWDLPNVVFAYSDFLGGTGVTSDFQTQASGTGASVSTTTDGGESGHPGIATCSTGTTTTGFAIIRTGNAGPFRTSGGTLTLETCLKLSALSDGTETYTCYVSLSAASTSDGNGAYFRYTHSNNSGKWECITQIAGATQTVTDSGVTATTGYQKFRIVLGTSSCQFWANGSLVQTHTTNLPTSSQTLGLYIVIVKSAGTTARTMGVDYLGIKQDLSSSR